MLSGTAISSQDARACCASKLLRPQRASQNGHKGVSCEKGHDAGPYYHRNGFETHSSDAVIVGMS